MLRSGWFPSFGNGPPGAKVPQSMPYFDVQAVPGVWYQYRNGAWHGAGGRQDFNATSIRGVAVSAVAPTNGQVLTLVGGIWKAN